MKFSAMASSLDGSHKRAITSTKAIVLQGTSACPEGIVSHRNRSKPKPLDEFESQPRSAELPAVLDADRTDIDFDPLRLGFGKQRLLRGGRLIQRGLLDAQSARLIELTQPRHDPLPGPALGAVGFHQRPVRPACPSTVLK